MERNVHAPQVLWENEALDPRKPGGNTGDKYGQGKEIHDQYDRSAEPTVSVIFYPCETLGSL